METLEQLQNALKGYELEIDTSAIKDHIDGLRSIGIPARVREYAGKDAA